MDFSVLQVLYIRVLLDILTGVVFGDTNPFPRRYVDPGGLFRCQIGSFLGKAATSSGDKKGFLFSGGEEVL